MKIKLTKKFIDNFEKFKLNNNQYGKEVCDLKEDSIIGQLHWNKPKDVLWMYATDNYEDYEGSQTQIGLKKDGTVVWGFFSHCSCFGYEYYEGDYQTFEDKEESFKSYEMENVDKKILTIIKQRIKFLLKVIKDES